MNQFITRDAEDRPEIVIRAPILVLQFASADAKCVRKKVAGGETFTYWDG